MMNRLGFYVYILPMACLFRLACMLGFFRDVAEEVDEPNKMSAAGD